MNACIALVGGIPGSGKSELIKFISEHVNALFDWSSTRSGDATPLDDGGHEKIPVVKKIIFDEICSIEDQIEMVKKMNGWRQFRIQLLEAAERYMCEVCNTECQLQGPLSLHSQEILEKIRTFNYHENDDCSVPSDVVFLIEDNFYYVSMRYEWFQIAKRDGLGFCQIIMTCPLELACQRNKERDHPIPEHKIKIMYSCIEYPDAEKNRWEKFSLMFNSSEALSRDSVLCVIELIKTAMRQPAELVLNEKKLEAQILCSKSVLHQADKVLRKLTGELIKELKGQNGRVLAEPLINDIVKTRQTLYNELKQGVLKLPSDIIEDIKSSGIHFKENHESLEQALRSLYKEKCNLLHR